VSFKIAVPLLFYAIVFFPSPLVIPTLPLPLSHEIGEGELIPRWRGSSDVIETGVEAVAGRGTE